jgi:hypothetical protein
LQRRLFAGRTKRAPTLRPVVEIPPQLFTKYFDHSEDNRYNPPSMKQSTRTMTGMAGAVALAGASQAYGTIINVAAPTDIPGNAPNTAGTTREFWDVDTGQTTSTRSTGGDSIEFAYLNSSTYTESFTGLYVFGGKPVAYYASNGVTYPYPLAKGTTIGTGGPYSFYQTSGKLSFLAFSYGGNFYGFNSQNSLEYVGFDFTSTDGLVHDGWVELESISNDGTDLDGGLTFVGAAYNSVPDSSGGTITAGQSGTNAVPEPGTLAALAVGAVGLAGAGLRRRRRASLAAAQA